MAEPDEARIYAVLTVLRHPSARRLVPVPREANRTAAPARAARVRSPSAGSSRVISKPEARTAFASRPFTILRVKATDSSNSKCSARARRNQTQSPGVCTHQARAPSTASSEEHRNKCSHSRNQPSAAGDECSSTRPGGRHPAPAGAKKHHSFFPDSKQWYAEVQKGSRCHWLPAPRPPATSHFRSLPINWAAPLSASR